MSGSSLDGLDLCVVDFGKTEDKWVYEIIHSETVEIPNQLREQLEKSPKLSSESLLTIDHNYGQWIGERVNTIVQPLDLIAIHGHTVFHSPEKGLSLQIGNGEIIHQLTNVPTVINFRNLDIQLGGQGAPLVSMGEKLLFPEFDGFLNLGGICNGSFNPDANWIAGDIGPFNQVLNFYSEKLESPFDDKGQLASSGEMIQSLLDSWNSLDFFKSPFPKSLGNQWVKDHFLQDYAYPPTDVLRTFSTFISVKIADILNQYQPQRVMVTGGGAYNTFLVDQIRKQTKVEIVIPDKQLVEFKEALIFAFLGLLRIRNQPNVLSSCTGASKDSSSGDIYSSEQNV